SLESLQANYGIEGAVRADRGQIYILMFTNDNQHAITGSGPLFKLYGQVKEDAETGQETTVSLSNFEISFDGESRLLNSTQAVAALRIVAAGEDVDKSELIEAVANAESIFRNAVVGS